MKYHLAAAFSMKLKKKIFFHFLYLKNLAGGNET